MLTDFKEEFVFSRPCRANKIKMTQQKATFE